MVLTEAKARVLVVDDEPSILASISDLLEPEFDVTTTTDPRRGLEHLARQRSSAVRVLLTGFADVEALVRAVNDGKIYAYVSKPWDPAQRFTLVNWAFARLAGMGDPAEAIGKTELECLPGAFGRIASNNGRLVLETGEPIVSKCDEWQRDNGSACWYSTTRIPIYSLIDHHLQGLIGVPIDITEQKQTEHYLREAKQTAEKTARAKEEFLARTSHEIRTPLNSILGMAQHYLKRSFPSRKRATRGYSVIIAKCCCASWTT
jgi:PAS domain S-box-containing protein